MRSAEIRAPPYASLILTNGKDHPEEERVMLICPHDSILYRLIGAQLIAALCCCRRIKRAHAYGARLRV